MRAPRITEASQRRQYSLRLSDLKQNLRVLEESSGGRTPGNHFFTKNMQNRQEYTATCIFCSALLGCQYPKN